VSFNDDIMPDKPDLVTIHPFLFDAIFRHILHKYSNEDVSFGSWLIGLDVEHVDERSLCCGTPPGWLSSFYLLLHYLLDFVERVT
jgi:hypothetical protein